MRLVGRLDHHRPKSTPIRCLLSTSACSHSAIYSSGSITESFLHLTLETGNSHSRFKMTPTCGTSRMQLQTCTLTRVRNKQTLHVNVSAFQIPQRYTKDEPLSFRNRPCLQHKPPRPKDTPRRTDETSLERTGL